jgi:hypothetical protein
MYNDCKNINSSSFDYYFKMFKKNSYNTGFSAHTVLRIVYRKWKVCSYLLRFYAVAIPETTDMSYAEIIYRQLESLIMQAE